MSVDLGVALIGCGRISERHARAVRETEGLRLHAVCDYLVQRARVLGEKYGVPWGCNMYGLIEHSRPDIISILTPSGLHSKHVCDLARYGIPIVVEKPMALTLASADAMIEACASQGTSLFVVKQNRFNLPVRLLREALEARMFGRLRSATVCVRWCRHDDYHDDWHGRWEMAGGVLANQASHHIDLLQWMMGVPVGVFAYDATRQGIDVEDLLVGVVEFYNGALASIEVTTATRPTNTEGSLTVIGERGMVKVGGFACNKLETWQFEGAGPQMDFDAYAENPPNVYGYGHLAYYAHVRDCLLNGATPIVDGAEARKGLALTVALYQSAEQHREVRLEPRMLASARLGR